MNVLKKFGAGLVLAVVAISASAGALSNYVVNKDVDFLFRAQAFTPATTLYVALATTTGTAAACGTEVTGGSYARVAITSGLAGWAGTQGAGTTVASTGTSGATSNNAAITFATPTASWGTVTSVCVFDAATAGNLIFQTALTSSQTISNGQAAPSFGISALTLTIN